MFLHETEAVCMLRARLPSASMPQLTRSSRVLGSYRAQRFNRSMKLSEPLKSSTMLLSSPEIATTARATEAFACANALRISSAACVCCRRDCRCQWEPFRAVKSLTHSRAALPFRRTT